MAGMVGLPLVSAQRHGSQNARPAKVNSEKVRSVLKLSQANGATQSVSPEAVSITTMLALSCALK